MSAQRSPGPVGDEVGTLCLVLHTHLPWLAHHGSWPVGEEWLYQAWASSYLPVTDVLARLAAEGRRDLVTLGITPVVAAQLDDPYLLREFHTWLGFWAARAEELAADRDASVAAIGQYEAGLARTATARFERDWRSGGSPVLRALTDKGAIELLSGPATHPFLPLLDEELAQAALAIGRADARLRLGARPPGSPSGIWAPECGYRPGLESIYQRAGVTHLVADGPTLLHVGCGTGDAWLLGDSDVAVFGRDLDVTYRVWSPRRGYPGGPQYRDFHAFHPSGFRVHRVTSPQVAAADKAWYEPHAATQATSRDADDFVATVHRRLSDLRQQRGGRPAVVVAAYDTELFGHWWHEGPAWLEHVLRRAPEAGIRVSTLRSALERGAVAGRAEPDNGSWGSGKDWRVWNGAKVAGLAAENEALQRRWRKLVATYRVPMRDPVLDQLARNALLALSSDWAFMVTKDSAAGYALDRHRHHHAAFARLAAAIEAGHSGQDHTRSAAGRVAIEQQRTDGVFGHLDGRLPGIDL